jgi:methionyl-tRNA formyltransferase
MNKSNFKIVYMGTPEFAVEPLKQLVENDFQIVAVVTNPDKPVGRHRNSLQASPVKQYALSKGLPILQPEKLKNQQFLDQLKQLQPDLQVVVAFKMLPECVWKIPKYGTVNLHASLLPKYRGAAPINWAIINGEIETGVTTFFITHEMDTGNIILQQKVPIAITDDAGILHDKLMNVGAQLMVETVDNIVKSNGKVHAIMQNELLNEMNLPTAPKIFTDTCKINWTQNTKPVYDFIRGLAPYPAAWTTLANSGEVLHVFNAEMNVENHQLRPGTLRSDQKTFLEVATKDGFVKINSLRLAGKKKMNTKEFLNGNKLNEDAVK